MNPNTLRDKYINFFKSQGHAHIPSASLVPENDPTTLFTSSGMQPLVPYLLGEPHSQGTRLVDSQKSFRSQDIEEVGDNRHTTFFEMLGNWSLGDYFKKEQLEWVFTFLTDKDSGLGLDPQKIYITVFSGDQETGVETDTESIEIWTKLFGKKQMEAKYIELHTEELGYQNGMNGGRIFGYGVKKNWWSRSGVPAAMPEGEPGGPDSEIFYDFGTPHDKSFGPNCHPNCDCGRFLEIGNSVFMQFKKEADGSLVELPNKNVDFGGGLERMLAAVNNNSDVFTTSLFTPVIKVLETHSQKSYSDSDAQTQMRVIVDHLRASIFLISDGVLPSNKAQGYFLRRLIRRSVVKLNQLEIPNLEALSRDFCSAVIDLYHDVYFKPSQLDEITQVIVDEIRKFEKTLNKGLKMFEKADLIDGKMAFDLLQTYGFPFELTLELATEKNQKINKAEFEKAFMAHQDLSRNASKGMFKGGLVDQSEATTKLHTATHLLHTALRNILGSHVRQEGSHITGERLRFDFAHTKALTADEIKLVEDEINSKINEDLQVVKTIEDKEAALSAGAIAFFREKYPDKVSVYTIGNESNFYSKEFCGGPHVEQTGVIGKIELFKEQSIGAGKRRLYARIRS